MTATKPPSKIREMRLRAGMTQRQAGEAMGYSPFTADRIWWELENGQGHQVRTLYRVAKVLGCNVHQLI